MDELVPRAFGVLLLALGATGAGALHRRQHGRPVPASLLALAPFGVLIGGGAALVRGWDLGLSAVAGALAVVVVALGGDVLAARRRSRARRASGGPSGRLSDDGRVERGEEG